MKKIKFLLIILWAASCSESDDSNPCDPKDALLETITDSRIFSKYTFEYYGDGKIKSAAEMSIDEKEMYWKEFFTWEAGKLKSYERRTFIFEQPNPFTRSYVSERCTYEYTGNDITKVYSVYKESEHEIAKNDVITITYHSEGIPHGFYSEEQDATFEWTYTDDDKINVFDIVKNDTIKIAVLNYTNLTHYYPQTYRYVRMYKRHGMFQSFSESAPSKDTRYSENGNLSYIVTYDYETNDDGKIVSLGVEVSSCPGCNSDRKITYACIK